MQGQNAALSIYVRIWYNTCVMQEGLLDAYGVGGFCRCHGRDETRAFQSRLPCFENHRRSFDDNRLHSFSESKNEMGKE